MLEVSYSALMGLKENSVQKGDTIMYKNTLHMKGMIDPHSLFQIFHPSFPSPPMSVHSSVWEPSSLTVVSFFSFYVAIPSLVLSKVKVELSTFDNVHSLNVNSVFLHVSQPQMPLC